MLQIWLPYSKSTITPKFGGRRPYGGQRPKCLIKGCNENAPTQDRKYCSRICYYKSKVGKKHTLDSIKIMKEKRALQVFSPETCKKIRDSNRGRKNSEETKLKMSISHTGKKLSPEHIAAAALGQVGKPKNGNRGQNHWNWKGGISEENHIQRTRVGYKNWRRAVFERDNWTCKLPGCRQVGGDLEANHIKRFADFPELREITLNGITLCKPHHRMIYAHEKEYERLFTNINLATCKEN